MSTDEIRYTNRIQLSWPFEETNYFLYFNPVEFYSTFILFTHDIQGNTYKEMSIWYRISSFSHGLIHSLCVTEMYNNFLLYSKVFVSV